MTNDDSRSLPTSSPASPPLIVAAALIRPDGRGSESWAEPESRFLAARRTYPPTLSGLWEFPGGKVEKGEDPHTALIRECWEELELPVVVGPEILPDAPDGAGGWTVTEGLTMRVFIVFLDDVDPSAAEPVLTSGHDEARWLPLTDAALDCDWIPANRPIVEALLETAARARAGVNQPR